METPTRVRSNGRNFQCSLNRDGIVGSVEGKVLLQAEKEVDIWILLTGAEVFQPAGYDN